MAKPRRFVAFFVMSPLFIHSTPPLPSLHFRHLAQKMSQKIFMISPFSFFICLILVLCFTCINVGAASDEESESYLGSLVKKKDERKLISSSEYGEISGVSVRERTDLSYHLQFITLKPFALFLPVVLHANMVFYAQTGSGKLSYTTEAGRMLTKTLRQGDTLELNPGTIFFMEAIHCVDELRVYAIFGNLREHFRGPATTAPYSSFRHLILGFDKMILQLTFKVPEDVIKEIMNKPNPPAIVSSVSGTMEKLWDLEARFIKELTRSTGPNLLNMLGLERDCGNHNGWRTTSNKKKLPDFKGFKGSNFGVSVTNLTRGSMVAPHWNQMATEIVIVLQGKGIVLVVCSSIFAKQNECKNMRFQVGEGDVFVVPRFHPTAQMSFSDETFVFMRFSTTRKKISHQYLVGKTSIFKTLGKRILAASLGVNETIADMVMASQRDSVVLDCNLCAEEELRMMEEEIEKAKQTEPETPEAEVEAGEGTEKPEEESGEGKDRPEKPEARAREYKNEVTIKEKR
ncbi:vicilin-like seed storage protein At2g18540 [Coffea arabica]|uniref:Vicilin-like seed storage protein At2g18540 n=1 Tax=Coffea arabica TaxID=13443 RepID=A0A6P6T7I9_COFAR|nr:vicilin-like seed storage protein At2g18540 [Coffea arabica]